MKQWFLSVIFIWVSFLIEVSALSLQMDIRLPLSLIALVFCSVKYGELVGQIMGLMLGLMLDVVSGTPVGFYILSYLTIGYVFGLCFKESLIHSWFISLFCFVGARVILGGFSFFLAIFFDASPWELTRWSQGFFLGLVFCPLYVSILNFLDAVFTGKRLTLSQDL